jgi:hypothetical protein
LSTPLAPVPLLEGFVEVPFPPPNPLPWVKILALLGRWRRPVVVPFVKAPLWGCRGGWLIFGW